MNKPQRADLGQPMGGERKRLKMPNPSLTAEARKIEANVADARIETLVDILRTNLKDTNATPQQFSHFKLKFIEFLLVFSKEVDMATTLTAPHQLSEVRVGEGVKKAKVGEGVKKAEVGEGVKKVKVGEGVKKAKVGEGVKEFKVCSSDSASVSSDRYQNHKLYPRGVVIRKLRSYISSDSSSEGASN